MAVGPEEYADIWLECVDRVLVTTNVGTRVNIRTYRREPRVTLFGADAKEIADAKTKIAAAFKPFVETPDGRPRPLTVLIDFHNTAPVDDERKLAALTDLAGYVRSGEAAGLKKAPAGQRLGLLVWPRMGPTGRDQAFAAIELASRAGIDLVVIDGVSARQRPTRRSARGPAHLSLRPVSSVRFFGKAGSTASRYVPPTCPTPTPSRAASGSD